MTEANLDGIRRSALGPAVTLAATGLWLLLAIRTPTNTYHFAPIIAAASWPLIARGSTRTPTRRAVGIAVSSGSVVVAAGLLLWAIDRLRGPTLWGPGDAVIETVIFAWVGAGIGLMALLRHDP